jgi:hypothetical protein
VQFSKYVPDARITMQQIESVLYIFARQSILFIDVGTSADSVAAFSAVVAFIDGNNDDALDTSAEHACVELVDNSNIYTDNWLIIVIVERGQWRHSCDTVDDDTEFIADDHSRRQTVMCVFSVFDV